MSMSRIARAIGLGALVLSPWTAVAQTFPTKPIRVVVGAAAGGNGDIVARIAAEGMSRELGQALYIDNQPVGRQIPAGLAVARAVPDGHTVLAIGLAFTANAVLYNDLPYDSIKDFAPFGIVGSTPELIVSAPGFPPNNIKELIALARAKPNTVHYGSTGPGSTAHLGGELFNSMAGVKLVHVPYKGTAQANTDTISGVIELSFPAAASVAALIKGGKLKALGIASLKRSPQMPDVPAIAETVPGYEAQLWNGMAAPAHTPKPIITRLNVALNKSITSPDIKDKLVKAGVDVDPQSPEQAAAYLEAEIKKWGKVVKEAGIEGER